MRLLIALAAVAALSLTARAEDGPPATPTKFYLVDGRIESAEKRIAELEKRVTELEKQVAAAKTAKPAPTRTCPNCTSCAAGCSCFGSGYYCCDGSCPVTIQSAGPAAGPIITTASGRKIRQTPTGYVYADQPAPVHLQPSCSGGSCPGGVCPAPSTGWYPGKLLGR